MIWKWGFCCCISDSAQSILVQIHEVTNNDYEDDSKQWKLTADFRFKLSSSHGKMGGISVTLRRVPIILTSYNIETILNF